MQDVTTGQTCMDTTVMTQQSMQVAHAAQSRTVMQHIVDVPSVGFMYKESYVCWISARITHQVR